MSGQRGRGSGAREQLTRPTHSDSPPRPSPPPLAGHRFFAAAAGVLTTELWLDSLRQFNARFNEEYTRGVEEGQGGELFGAIFSYGMRGTEDEYLRQRGVVHVEVDVRDALDGLGTAYHVFLPADAVPQIRVHTFASLVAEWIQREAGCTLLTHRFLRLAASRNKYCFVPCQSNRGIQTLGIYAHEPMCKQEFVFVRADAPM